LSNAYLLQRGQGWYVRVRVPTELVATVGRTHLVRSLKTSDLAEARRRRWAAMAELWQAMHGQTVADGRHHAEKAFVTVRDGSSPAEKAFVTVADGSSPTLQGSATVADGWHHAEEASTTGTGSGKSLSYFIPIVDHVLRAKRADPGRAPSITAIVVYPMNVLCNSQLEELGKFLTLGYPPGSEPVTFARYTG
jgi:hypothetical protein